MKNINSKTSTVLQYLMVAGLFFIVQCATAQTTKLIKPIQVGECLSKKEVKVIQAKKVFRNWGIEFHNLTGYLSDKGEGFKVCILDTGTPDHSELISTISNSKNFTDERSGIDNIGHATHVAGIIHEILPKAEFYYGKVLGEGGGYTEWYIEGIEWCRQMKVDVINSSLGSSYESGPEHAAIRNANADGIHQVAAAGNSGFNEDGSIDFPARYPEVIAVGSIDQQGQWSVFSSTGSDGDVMASGEMILSTYLKQEYVILSGTSMSAPMTTAMIGLLRSVNLTPEQMKAGLRKFADDVKPTGFDVKTFQGVANIETLMEYTEPVFEVSDSLDNVIDTLGLEETITDTTGTAIEEIITFEGIKQDWKLWLGGLLMVLILVLFGMRKEE